MKNEIQDQVKRKRIVKKTLTANLSIEERLRIFANLIVDRVIEDQKNGVVRIPDPSK